MNNIKTILGSLLLLVTSSVVALPIVGDLEMGGSFFALDGNGRTVSNASLATSIDFDFFGFDMFVVNAADGDFTGLAGQYGNIQDIQFDPFVGPVVDFWSIDTFSFELTSLTREFTNNPDDFLVLSGVGILSSSIAGLDDTAATWSFSGDTTGAGVFSWSASTGIDANVPEPSLLFLLSLGLIGIGIRKKL